MKNPLWFIFWLLMLLSISFIVGFIGAFCYIWLYLFSQCCDCLRVSLVFLGNYASETLFCFGFFSSLLFPQSVAQFFLKCAQFPGYCAAAMLNCQSLC